MANRYSDFFGEKLMMIKKSSSNNVLPVWWQTQVFELLDYYLASVLADENQLSISSISPNRQFL